MDFINNCSVFSSKYFYINTFFVAIAPGCDLDNLLSTVQLHEKEILQACDTINGKTCSMKCNRLIDGIKILYPNCFDNQPVGLDMIFFIF